MCYEYLVSLVNVQQERIYEFKVRIAQTNPSHYTIFVFKNVSIFKVQYFDLCILIRYYKSGLSIDSTNCAFCHFTIPFVSSFMKMQHIYHIAYCDKGHCLLQVHYFETVCETTFLPTTFYNFRNSHIVENIFLFI